MCYQRQIQLDQNDGIYQLYATIKKEQDGE